ncbi:hypothetical protein BJV82DRAFT_674615 [Fennellomyces sp. T-0311]|nr:hypothetical protein BJV82DRAFT_674615 [Fennellomyces sp. T-0311]
MEAMLDGGATVSIMPFWIAEEAGLTGKITPTNQGFSYSGKFEQKVVGRLTEVTLTMSEELDVIHSFLIAEDPDTPFLLGLDFMVGAKVVTDPIQECITFSVEEGGNERVIRIPTHEGNGVRFKEDNNANDVMTITRQDMGNDAPALVTLVADLTLGPNEISILDINELSSEEKVSQDTVTILEPVTSALQKGIIVMPTIRHETLKDMTAVGNISNKEIRLKAGETIGMMMNSETTLLEWKNGGKKVTSSHHEVVDFLANMIVYPDQCRLPSHSSSFIFMPEARETGKAGVIHQVNMAQVSQGEKSDLNGFDINPELPQEDQLQILSILEKHSKVFVTKLEEVNKLRVEPYKIRLKPNAIPHKTALYPIPHDASIWLKEHLKKLTELGMIEPSTSPWAAGTVLVPSDREKQKPRRRKAKMRADLQIKKKTRQGQVYVVKKVWTVEQGEKED